MSCFIRGEIRDLVRNSLNGQVSEGWGSKIGSVAVSNAAFLLCPVLSGVGSGNLLDSGLGAESMGGMGDSIVQ
jgi:hypothetical protein